ncbi:MAG TPA: endonuclease domain-containing protein [Rhizomicrobium sp.]|nr:endonuclease domain-containing protein [Rhizomicrobium sp.]
MTLPEVLLWNALRGGQLQNLRFRRQHPVGPYILDFYCPSARLAVEVDGAVHSRERQCNHDGNATFGWQDITSALFGLWQQTF